MSNSLYLPLTLRGRIPSLRVREGRVSYDEEMSLQDNVKLLAWHNFFTDFRLYAPVAILYFAKVTGSYALGMSIFAITMVSQAVLEVPTGIFSDLVGRARTVTLGSLAMVIGTICYAIGGIYGWLIIGALFEGLSRSFYSGNNDALLHDTLSQINKRDDYADKLGKLSALFQAALAISAILGSIIAGWSFTLVMWLSLLPQILCFLISLRLVEPKITQRIATNPYSHLKEAWLQLKHNSRLKWLAFASTIGTSAGEAIYLFNSTFIASLWPVWAIGIQKAMANGGATISFLTAGKIIKRYGEFPVMVWSRLYGRITSILAYAWPTPVSPLILVSHSLLYGTITVADNALKQKEYTANQRATMSSMISLLHSLGTGMMTILIGMLGDWWGILPALLIMQIFQTIPLLVYWGLWKGKNRKALILA